MEIAENVAINTLGIAASKVQSVRSLYQVKQSRT